MSEHKEITSLGGGSDTTVALAAALNADYAEICSDVDGVYSADHELLAKPIHQDSIEYSDMQAFADAGAKVLHADAVEWASGQDRCSLCGDSRWVEPIYSDHKGTLNPRFRWGRCPW